MNAFFTRTKNRAGKGGCVTGDNNGQVGPTGRPNGSRKLHGLGIAALAGVATAIVGITAAQAASVDVTRFDTVVFDIAPSGVNTFTYNAIQPTISGQDFSLERVSVEVIQYVGLRVDAPENITIVPPVSIPTAYNFSYLISQDFSPALFGSTFPDGFETDLGPSVLASGVATGQGGTATIHPISFNYSFSFDATSDLIGPVPTSIGGVVTGPLEEFLATDFQDEISSMVSLSATQVSGVQPTELLAFFGVTSLVIRYDGVLELEDGRDPPDGLIEERPETPDVTVSTAPLPAGLPLLLAGLAGLGLLSRRRAGAATRT